MDGVNNPQCKRASSQAKVARHWKWAKAQSDYTESELSSEEESALSLQSDQSNDLSDLDSEYRFTEDSKPSTELHTTGTSNPDLNKGDKILGPQGKLLFEPNDLRHPHSAEWSPTEHVAQWHNMWHLGSTSL
ncbi:Hypothetical predicted protein [Pelobates cultripes]|uniref:Uncharacterized protein n=1 Tax=Pelobates cultripes TaxID=61616 RepID=A0AAD1RM17_PELCU|nr:Hypothetical predicted protein [Pelobates cultripes]